MNSYATLTTPPAVLVHEPVLLEVPMVFDSPHSSDHMPEDAQVAAPAAALASAQDAYVQELWCAVPREGGVLLEAGFHRTYIDANRSRKDIDQDLLDAPWPGPMEPSASTQRGMGLIRRMALPGVPMYERRLTVPEVQHRLTHCYDAYHAALRSSIERCHARFGKVWHVNCHSMKSVGNAMNVDNGKPRPDFVISDREGSSSDIEFTHWLAATLGQMGYQVSINDPYKGAEILRLYGEPARHINSVQIEINRRLYMNEQTRLKHEGFHKLQADLSRLVRALKLHIHQRL